MIGLFFLQFQFHNSVTTKTNQMNYLKDEYYVTKVLFQIRFEYYREAFLSSRNIFIASSTVYNKTFLKLTRIDVTVGKCSKRFSSFVLSISLSKSENIVVYVRTNVENFKINSLFLIQQSCCKSLNRRVELNRGNIFLNIKSVPRQPLNDSGHSQRETCCVRYIVTIKSKNKGGRKKNLYFQ